jgi:UbiD family decarboxylase
MDDLQNYLKDVQRNHPEELQEIKETVSHEYEVTAYWYAYSKLNNPILFFKSVEGYNMPLVTNIFGNVNRVARIIGAEPKTMYDAWSKKQQTLSIQNT